MIKYDNPIPFTVDQAEVFGEDRYGCTPVYDWICRELNNIVNYSLTATDIQDNFTPWTPKYDIQKVWKHALHYEWEQETFHRII